ncbi:MULTISPECIES: CapA family protein [Staphylococcus]|uniref:CapA family protein n=1 Tax=Staphylococcus hsinchuensis TaxID=3051183 RepID=A0ABZ3EA80_9STAP|nr:MULTISPECIES: CapA family protein [unclassified Staphylococcus]
MRKIVLSFFVIAIILTVGYGVFYFTHSEKIKFVAVGDNLIHPVVYNDAKTNNNFNFDKMYHPIKSYIKNKDIAYINQESPMGGDDRPFHGFKQFNTPSAIAGSLVDTGFNLINGSNNHALDQGLSGVNARIKTWEKYKDKVLFTGTFNSQEDRDKTHVLNIKGIKVSMLSYTFGTNGLKPEKPYLVNYLNKHTMKRDIKRAKKHSDMVIVSTHWGNEGKHFPNKTQQDYAKFLAQQNVDAVIGTHPHVIQPVKWIQGNGKHKTLVAYSLGNFLNGQQTGTESNHLGGSVQFDITKQAGKIKIDHVKWRSIVNHYEMPNPYDVNSKRNFKLYMLDDYTNELARKHGVQFNRGAQMSKPRLVTLTKDIIDDQFLDDSSY